jgi:DNA-binding transcriptional LysR family regulator
MTTVARLRAFVAVADTGSVRAAAQRLVVSESAVSAALGALAREVGVPLVEREGRGLRLTLSGTTYAAYARKILGLHDEALSAARGDIAPERGRVRVAAVTTAGEHVLPEVLAGFRRRYPAVELWLDVDTSEHVWASLGSHEVDLAIAGRPPQDMTEIVVRAVRANELVAVAAPAVAETFDPGRTTWLMRESGSGTRTTCEALLESLEIDAPLLTLGSNGAVVAGAVAGLGVTLVSRDAVSRELASDELVEVAIPGTPLSRPWHTVTHGRTPASVELLVEYLLRHEHDTGLGWHRPVTPYPPHVPPGGGR